MKRIKGRRRKSDEAHWGGECSHTRLGGELQVEEPEEGRELASWKTDGRARGG